MTSYRVFNRWDRVTQNWYLALESRKLCRGKAVSLELCGKPLVLFRSQDGRVTAMDRYCSHMGSDLGLGCVEGDKLRCSFHHWRYGPDGRVDEIPAQCRIPSGARVKTWPVEERYGFIWVFAGETALWPILRPPGLEEGELDYLHGMPYERNCHVHVLMLNAIDPQHFKYVHNLDIELEYRFAPTGPHEMYFEGLCDIPRADRLAQALRGGLPGRLGDGLIRAASRVAAELPALSENGKLYYAMRYVGATSGSVTIGLGKRRLHAIFANKIGPNRTTVGRTILIARKGAWLPTRAMLLASWLGTWYFSRGDRKIFDTIQFKAGQMLEVDRPILDFIAHAETMPISDWTPAVPLRTVEEPADVPARLEAV